MRLRGEREKRALRPSSAASGSFSFLFTCVSGGVLLEIGEGRGREANSSTVYSTTECGVLLGKRTARKNETLAIPLLWDGKKEGV